MRTTLATVALWFVCAANATVEAQVATVPLTPEVQIQFDSGVAAYRRQEWSAAIKYFETAVYDPNQINTKPQVAFNLGLTHRANGNDVAALAWFEAYLLIAPDAPNRADVERAVDQLEAETTRRSDILFQEAIRSALQLGGNDRSNALANVALEQALAGDFDAAVSTARLRSTDGSVTPHFMDWLRIYYTIALSGSGRGREAAGVLAMLQTAAVDRNQNLKALIDEAFMRLAQDLSRVEYDFPAARLAIAQIEDPRIRKQASDYEQNEYQTYQRSDSAWFAASRRNRKPNSISAVYLAQGIAADRYLIALDSDVRLAAGMDAALIPQRLGALAGVRSSYLFLLRSHRAGNHIGWGHGSMAVALIEDVYLKNARDQ